MTEDLARWFILSDGVDEVAVTYLQALSYQQTYGSIGGYAIHRMMSGRAVKMTNWSKLTTTISGSGRIPPGLQALDYSQEMTLKCGASLSHMTNALSVSLPPNRSDGIYVPYAYAWKDDAWTAADVTIGGVITPVAGASKYLVCYFPEISVVVNPPDISHDFGNMTTGWSLTAEET